uniref:39S ribosomal protein L30, mitochondrial n=1 Tax=Oncorhynchus mykiss TaxID=8022 RepID=A0A8K9V057_ONCMY
MAMLCRGLHIFSPIQVTMKSNLLKEDNLSGRHKFTRARIPQEVGWTVLRTFIKGRSMVVLRSSPVKMEGRYLQKEWLPSGHSSIKPLTLPHGLPTEEDTYLNSRELIIRHLKHVEDSKAVNK